MSTKRAEGEGTVSGAVGGRLEAIKAAIKDFYGKHVKSTPAVVGAIGGGAAGYMHGAKKDEKGQTHKLRDTAIGAAAGGLGGAAAGKYGPGLVEGAANKAKELVNGPKAASQEREALLWNEVYLPAFVSKCASLGVTLDESTINDAIESTYILKKYAEDSRNNVVKSASFTLKKSFGLIQEAPRAEDQSVKQAAAALAQHPEIQSAFLA